MPHIRVRFGGGWGGYHHRHYGHRRRRGNPLGFLIFLFILGIIFVAIGASMIAKGDHTNTTTTGASSAANIQAKVDDFNAAVDDWSVERTNFDNLQISVTDGETTYPLTRTQSEIYDVSYSGDISVNYYSPLKYSIDLQDLFGNYISTNADITKTFSISILDPPDVFSNFTAVVAVVRRLAKTQYDLNCCPTTTTGCTRCSTACIREGGSWNSTQNVCNIIEVIDGSICIKIDQSSSTEGWEQDTATYGTPSCYYAETKIYSTTTTSLSSYYVSSFSKLDVRSPYDPWIVAQQLTEGSLYFEGQSTTSSTTNNTAGGVAMLIVGLVLIFIVIVIFVSLIIAFRTCWRGMHYWWWWGGSHVDTPVVVATTPVVQPVVQPVIVTQPVYVTQPPPQGYPSPQQGYPPPQQGYPPQGYPPPQQGYPPQGYPPPQQGYPPQGYPPPQQGYPPQGYPPQGYPPPSSPIPPAQGYPPTAPPQ